MANIIFIIVNILFGAAFIFYVGSTIHELLKLYRVRRLTNFMRALIPFIYRPEQCTAKDVIKAVDTLVILRKKKDPLYDKANRLFQDRNELEFEERSKLYDEIKDEVDGLLDI